MLHEVDFHEWCPKCEHFKLAEREDPCHDCLNEPINEDSRKPVMFKDAGKEKKAEDNGKLGTKRAVNTVVRTRKVSVTGKPI